MALKQKQQRHGRKARLGHFSIQIACAKQGIPSEGLFKKWVDAVLIALAQNLGECTLRIVNEDESHALNQTYRQRPYPTNVLTFPLSSGLESAGLNGDLVLCRQVVESEAKQQQKLCLHHWAHLVIHGLLHLANFQHDSEEQAAVMEKKEAQILSTLGYPNPYESSAYSAA